MPRERDSSEKPKRRPFGLRLDLLEEISKEEVLDQALKNQPHYSAEPVFSKTGIGSLKPRSIEESIHDAEHDDAMLRRIRARQTVRNHPLNTIALEHMNALGIEPKAGWLPALQLGLWAIRNQQENCSYQSPSEAEKTVIRWQKFPVEAMKCMEANITSHDLRALSPVNAAIRLMLVLTS